MIVLNCHHYGDIKIVIIFSCNPIEMSGLHRMKYTVSESVVHSSINLERARQYIKWHLFKILQLSCLKLLVLHEKYLSPSSKKLQQGKITSRSNFKYILMLLNSCIDLSLIHLQSIILLALS